ncbi:MAG TPA: hypothetical protein VK009_12260 [Chloroflexota bacterium]|nr:hypothetical protein [Chloroflexota bacterium]
MPASPGAAADKAKEAAVSQLTTQKGRAAEAMTSMAQSLRQAGQGLEQSQPPLPVHQYVTKAADQLEQLGTFIDQREVGEIVAEVEGFARRQPALFLGGAFAAGLMISRFLRSSGGNGGSSASPYASDPSMYGPSRTYGSEAVSPSGAAVSEPVAEL